MKGLCGLQAQELPAAALQVRVRAAGATAADVEHAQARDHSIVRTWCMRGTLHVLATEDLGWLLSLFGPVFVRAGRRRRADLGLDDDTCLRGVGLIRDALAGSGPLTKAGLVAALEGHDIPTEGQAAIHLIQYAALTGAVCVGPNRGAKPTYALLGEWVDLSPAPPREAALAELARRYLAAYGPAGGSGQLVRFAHGGGPGRLGGHRRRAERGRDQ